MANTLDSLTDAPEGRAPSDFSLPVGAYRDSRMTKSSNTRPPRRPFTPRVTPLTERVDSTAVFWEFPTEIEERPPLPEPLAPCAQVTLPPAPVSHTHGPLGFRRRPLIWLGIALTVSASAMMGLAVRASFRADAQELYLTPSGDLRSRPLRVFARQLNTTKPTVVPEAIERALAPLPDIPVAPPRERWLVRERTTPSRERTAPPPERAAPPRERATPPRARSSASRERPSAPPRASSSTPPRAAEQRTTAREERATAAASQAAAPAPAGFYGTLAVDSEPSGARVFINGRPAGSTPLVLEQMPAGSRVVRVEADAHQPWTAAIRIIANEQTHVVATLKQ